MSSIHKECGEPIRWAHRDDDPERFRPPLEYAGEAFIIDERDCAIFVHVYKPHMCDPAKMEAWQEYQAKLAALKERQKDLDLGGTSAYEIARERDRDSIWEIALKIPCPRCEVPSGMKCRSLNQRYIKTGEIVEVKNPHIQRLEAAQNG